MERDTIAWAGYLRTKADHTYDLRLSQILNAALEMGGPRNLPLAPRAFSEAIERYQGRFALKPLGRLLTSTCAPIWGAERGQRAARRALFELSWRTLGKKTFAAQGLPGRLFPQI